MSSQLSTKHEANETLKISVPAEEAWKKIREFNDMSWHPAVDTTMAESGNHIGSVRTIQLKGGGSLLEKLDAHSDGTRSYAYRMLDSGPLPISEYKSILSVNISGPDSCVIVWSGTFVTVNSDKNSTEIISDIYRAGLNSIRSQLESK